jgi:RNA polymerase sigma-70 factor, ECF subfamily
VALARADHGQDRSLLARMAGGDLDAFRQLLGLYQTRVLQTARRILGDGSEAEDVTQETFLKLWQTAATFEATGSGVEGWLRQVARNMALDRLRRSGRLTEFLPEHEPLDAPSQLSALVDRDTADQVAKAIAALPERQRLALVLFHFEDMSLATIARDLDTTEDAVVSLLSRARRTLRTELSDVWHGLLDNKDRYET